MGRYEQTVEVIYKALDEINENLEPDQAIDKSPNTILIGESSLLDSLGFVTLLASVEQEVEELFGQHISLIEVVTSDDMQGQGTVADLARGITDLVQPITTQ